MMQKVPMKNRALIYVGKKCYRYGYKKGFRSGLNHITQNSKYLKYDVFRKYYELHEKVLDFALTTNVKSYKKYP